MVHAALLVIATLADSAAAQSPLAPINTLNDLEAALLACWEPPPHLAGNSKAEFGPHTTHDPYVTWPAVTCRAIELCWRRASPSGFATAELHHYRGPDLKLPCWARQAGHQANPRGLPLTREEFCNMG